MRTVLALLLAALLTAPFVAASHSATASYTLASTPVVSFSLTGDIVNVGGVRFDPAGEVPVRADVDDASGGAVSFTVCQNWNGDNVCGNQNAAVGALEPTIALCGTTADLTTSAIPFRADAETLVFVRMVDNACAGRASSGTVTLTYA